MSLGSNTRSLEDAGIPLTLVGSQAAASAEGVTPSLDMCLASLSFYPVYSGPAVRFSRYLPGFSTRGVRVRVFSGTPNLKEAKTSQVPVTWQGRQSGEMLPVVMVNETPVHCVCLPEGSFQRIVLYSRALVRFCRQPGYRPDLIQFLSLPLWSVPWLIRLRSLGIPTVHTHTMLSELSSRRAKRALQRYYWRWPFQVVDCVVVSSGVMRDKLCRLGVTTRIDVIPNGVDTARFRPAAGEHERQEVRHALGIGKTESVILCVGPVTPRKGTDLLLEAWVRLAVEFPESQLYLVGPRHDLAYGFDEFRRRLEALVTASGAPDRVHFVGPVGNVEDYMRAADVLVFVSLREGMPNVVPEAMAAGLPVVMTPFLGLPEEFGRPDEHYLLANRDPNSLGALIGEVLQQSTRRERVGQSARRWVVEHMDVEDSVDRYAALYRDLARRSRVRAGA